MKTHKQLLKIEEKINGLKVKLLDEGFVKVKSNVYVLTNIVEHDKPEYNLYIKLHSCKLGSYSEFTKRYLDSKGKEVGVVKFEGKNFITERWTEEIPTALTQIKILITICGRNVEKKEVMI